MEILLLILIFIWSLTYLNIDTLRYMSLPKKKIYQAGDLTKLINIKNGKTTLTQVRVLKKLKTILTDTYVVEELLTKKQHIVSRKDLV